MSRAKPAADVVTLASFSPNNNLVQGGDRETWVHRWGVIGLYFFAFFAWLGTAGAQLGIGLMMFSALLENRIWQSVRRSHLLWLVGLFTFALLLSTGLALSQDPVASPIHLRSASSLLMLWAFVFVAWWMGGNQRRILQILAVACVGFWLGRLRAVGEMSVLLQGARVGFNLSPIAFGQYAAVVLLGLLMMAPRLWKLVSTRSGWVRGSAVALWTLLVLAASQGIIMSQSRGVWLAILLVFPPLFLVLGRDKLRTGRPTLALLVAGTVLLAGGLMLHLNRAVILERLAITEQAAHGYLQSGEVERIDDESIRARALMLQLGVARWLEQPWLGWGPGATPQLLAESGNPDLVKYNRLHNGYLEMLVRLGLVGSLPLLLGLILVLHALWWAYRERRIEQDVFLFLLGGLALHLLCNLSNFRMLNLDWRFYWFLFAGAAYTFKLRDLADLPRVPRQTS